MSKYKIIYEYLRELALNGSLRPGDMMPTDSEISKKFHASRPTVAKSMARLVEEGILGRRAGYGTYLLDFKKKGLTLGLLIPGLGQTEIFEPICAQIAELAERRSYALIWGGSGDAEGKRRSADQLAQRYIDQGVDGVFFTPVELIPEHEQINAEILDSFRQADIAVVLLDRDKIGRAHV